MGEAGSNPGRVGGRERGRNTGRRGTGDRRGGSARGGNARRRIRRCKAFFSGGGPAQHPRKAQSLQAGGTGDRVGGPGQFGPRKGGIGRTRGLAGRTRGAVLKIGGTQHPVRGPRQGEDVQGMGGTREDPGIGGSGGTTGDRAGPRPEGGVGLSAQRGAPSGDTVLFQPTERGRGGALPGPPVGGPGGGRPVGRWEVPGPRAGQQRGLVGFSPATHKRTRRARGPRQGRGPSTRASRFKKSRSKNGHHGGAGRGGGPCGPQSATERGAADRVVSSPVGGRRKKPQFSFPGPPSEQGAGGIKPPFRPRAGN